MLRLLLLLFLCLPVQAQSRLDPRLAVASAPWTEETLGWMTGRDDQAFLNWLNLFLEECEGDGTLKALRAQFQLP